jgi:uncharacterized protein (TIGR03437 family)
VNVVAPLSLTPGPHKLTIRSPYGVAEQTVAIAAVAPAIFLVGNPATGAVVNSDGTLNGPSAPASRGQYVVIYATGLGAVARQGSLSAAVTPVTVVLNGVELPVLFAGLTPGYPGLYQVNVEIPTNTGPGLGLLLTVKQAEQVSNVVAIGLQ